MAGVILLFTRIYNIENREYCILYTNTVLYIEYKYIWLQFYNSYDAEWQKSSATKYRQCNIYETVTYFVFLSSLRKFFWTLRYFKIFVSNNKIIINKRHHYRRIIIIIIWFNVATVLILTTDSRYNDIPITVTRG